jgi:hypothetical protein
MNTPGRDAQPSWQTPALGPQSGLTATLLYERSNMDNSETYVSQFSRKGLKGCGVTSTLR